jgi:hypothetical protein
MGIKEPVKKDKHSNEEFKELNKKKTLRELIRINSMKKIEIQKEKEE